MKLIDGNSVIEHAEVNGESREFIRKLMDYIEDADEVEPKTGDLISKKALLEQIDIDSEGQPGWYGDTWQFIDTIENMPTVEPKQGEWIIHGESPLYVKECSACGSKFFHHAFEDPTPYCAMCGARMLVAVSEEFKRFLEE